MLLLLLIGITLSVACGQKELDGKGVPLDEGEELQTSEHTEAETIEEPESAGAIEAAETEEVIKAEELSCLAPEGMTLESRIQTPEGYVRLAVEPGSFAEFLRNYPVKEDGSPVLLYDGSEKWNQSVHAAVLALPIEAADLQQCADSVMRIYAEYFYATGQHERIRFHFTNGFSAEYAKWR